jgi:hypothetical protein
LFLLLALLGSLSLLWGLYSSLTAEEKRETVDKMRHKVQAVPNLLRGHNPPVVPHAPPQGGGGGGHGPAAVDRFRPLAGDQAKVSESVSAYTGDGIKEYPYSLSQLATAEEVANYVPKGGFRFDEYTSGESPYSITAELREQSDKLARSRRVFVKKAMQFAWDGYTKYAFGYDEVMPQSARGVNGWGGQGITLVDALDTLWLMGMKDEFYKARDWVRDHLDHSKTGFVSVFETTIRDLGGLLSAYDLSHDDAFLTKATDLGRRLLKSYENCPSGINYGQVHLGDGSTKNIGTRVSVTLLI